MTPMPMRTERPEPARRGEAVTELSWKAAALGTINVLTAILAVRIILMIAVIGAIMLASLTLSTHDMVRVAVLGLYTLTVVCPLVWLAAQRR